MFGGVGVMMNGNMLCGVHKEHLILRLDPESAAEAMGVPAAKPFDITGRPMKGWIMMGEEGFTSDAELEYWINKARDFVITLPKK